MSRKPVNRLGTIDTRDAIWDAIRNHPGSFTVRQIYLETSLKQDSVREYIRGLVNAGYLLEDTTVRPRIYDLLKNSGLDAPRVRKDGSPVTQGQGQINMWRAMRTLQSFTARELAIHSSTESCEVKMATAESYCRYLACAGYLRGDKHGNYFFLPQRYTGPKPPMVQRTKQVWDANEKRVVWSSRKGEGDD